MTSTISPDLRSLSYCSLSQSLTAYSYEIMCFRRENEIFSYEKHYLLVLICIYQIFNGLHFLEEGSMFLSWVATSRHEAKGYPL